jgi:hypothetical protein
MYVYIRDESETWVKKSYLENLFLHSRSDVEPPVSMINRSYFLQ